MFYIERLYTTLECLLTSFDDLCSVDFPKLEGASVAFVVPHTAKKADFLVSATNTPHQGVVTYWRNNVRVSVRPRRPSSAGERCFAFFLPKSQKLEVQHV